MLKIDLNNEPVVTRMLQIRLDVLAAARQLATAYLNVFKAEYSMIQNHRDNAIIVEISAKTDLETSPIVRIRYDDRAQQSRCMCLLRIMRLYNSKRMTTTSFLGG